MAAVGDLQAVEHHHRQPDVVKPPAHQLRQRGGGALDEHLRHRCLAGRRGRLLDVCADGLADRCELAGRDAGEHAVHHRPRQRVAIGEVPVRPDRQLVLVVGRAHPRAAHRHAPTAERHRPVLMAVTPGRPVAVMLPLGPTTSVTSSSISSCTTPSPTPTLSASSPSLAAPTSSPSASWTCGGSGRSDASTVMTTFGTGTFFTAVPPVSDGLQAPRTLPTAADGAGGPPLKVLRDLGQPPPLMS